MPATLRVSINIDSSRLRGVARDIADRANELLREAAIRSVKPALAAWRSRMRVYTGRMRREATVRVVGRPPQSTIVFNAPFYYRFQRNRDTLNNIAVRALVTSMRRNFRRQL